MAGQNQPILVLSEDTERSKGKDAQKKNIEAAKAIADTVDTTLGPKGMDKMLVDSIGDVTITNDGVTMLKEMDIEHPAAKMVIEVAETQDDECGDGTTSAVILAGELLSRSEELIDKGIHPSIIAKGYRLAVNEALKILNDLEHPVDIEDEDSLKNIAMTAMTGKSIEMDKEDLADIVVEAVKHVSEKEDGSYSVDIDDIKVVKKAGASVNKTKMIDGIILDKDRPHEGLPQGIDDAKIALINSPLEVKETEIDTEVKITDTDQVQQFLDEEEKNIRQMVEKLEEVGANVLLCQKGIDDLAQHHLAKKGIFALRRVKKSDMKKLSRATGADIVTNIDDITQEDLGEAGQVQEKKVVDEKMTFIEELEKSEAASLLLRGGTDHVVEEVDRTLHDALKVVAVAIEDGSVLPGGGASIVELSRRIKDYAGKVEGRKQLAVETFAESLNVIPRKLAENAGLDGIDILMELNTAHEKEGKVNYGINLETEEVEDMIEEKVIEPLRVKKQALQSATELTDMVLLIDDVVASKGGEEGEQPPSPGGAPGGPAGMPGGGGGLPPGLG